jgi:hypothetical protein
VKQAHNSSQMAGPRHMTGAPDSAIVKVEEQEIQRIVDNYVKKTSEWYQRKKRGPRRLYKLSVGVTIVGGASIPLLASFEGPLFRLAVGVLGAAIAVVSGLSSFYRWERKWQIFAAAQFELEHALRVWELRLVDARSNRSQDEALKLIQAGTEQLLELTRRVRDAETNEFFTTLIRELRS